jgi:hypothetical protein
MHITPRSYLTAGIAALGAGAIALTPIQPIPDQPAPTAVHAVNGLAVTLAATIDPITPWVNTFKTAAANIAILGEFSAQKPLPLLTTWAANQGTYIQELFSGQGNLIPGQIWNNITTLFTAPFDPGETFVLPVNWDDPAQEPKEVVVATGTNLSNTQPAELTGTTPARTSSPYDFNLLGLQLIAGSAFNPYNDPVIVNLSFAAAPVLRILNTPISGQVISALGPLLSPVVALTRSFTAVGGYLKAGKFGEAINELINIPAAMTNAFLNGAGFFDVVPLIKPFVTLPDDFENLQAGINLGGLLNTMPKNGTLLTTGGPSNPPVAPTKWGYGTGLDSLGLPGCGGADNQLCDFVEGQPPTGLQNGPIGAAVGLTQYLAPKLLVTPPKPGQALAPASAVKAAAAVEEPVQTPAAAPVEDPVQTPATAPVEDPAAVVAPAPLAVPKIQATDLDPAPVSTPARARIAATNVTGNSAAAQNDSSDNAPVKHRGNRGR